MQRTVTILAICLLLSGCGGAAPVGAGLSPAQGRSETGPYASVPGGGIGVGAAPNMDELRSVLEAELERLGIDPSKAVAAAPQGEDNAVFDLSSKVIDPDGDGGEPPTGIELSWTEQLIGDYDQNGLVNYSDLTPVGQQWNEHVTYDDPALHGGFEHWPSGDPDDDGKSGSADVPSVSAARPGRRGRSQTGPGRVIDPPLRRMPSGSRRSQEVPAEGSGAQNWRRARIDGHQDGLIELGDITPIAQHYEEQLSGYRVYRHGPHDTDWALLPDPLDAESPLSIARPAELPTAPIRYSFADSPDYPGLYEYYVIGYVLGGSGESSMEADTQSNIAQATLILDAVDVYPPVWQDTQGIGSVAANEDGTVTVSWGEAVDVEHPPAPASPPVTYNLYYGTETPLDFASAVKTADATSPWTSPQLVNGREYYFAVRAQDSAAVANEDQNTNELAVTIIGGIVDDQWPVWTEKYDGGDTDYYAGIRSAKVGNGQVEIVCADAVDELSPPIHHDLYYMSARVNYTMRDEDWNFLPEARVIEDIPKEYTFYWENRHEVLLLVYARDSASPPNVRTSGREVSVAPTDLRKIVLDPFLPGVTTDCPGFGAAAVQDIERRRVYGVYAVAPRDETEKTYFVELSVETGDWEAELLLDDPLAQEYGYGRSLLAIAPSGALWSRIKVVTGTWGVGFYRYFHRPADGSWREIELPDPPDGFWNGILDLNEFPVFVSYGGTPDEGEYPLKLHFYEPEEDTWRAEVACDYAAYPLAFWRPDGVMQLTTTHGGTTADDIPRYVMERSPEGEWTEVLSGFGQITALPITTPQWDAEIAWAVLTTMRGELELLTYGEHGYSFLGVGEYDSTLTPKNFDSRKDDPYINQVWAAGALYHALPYWLCDGGQYLEWSYRAADELGNWQEALHVRLEEAHSLYAFGGDNRYDEEVGQLIWLDPFTGHCAFAGVEDNLITKRQQVYMLTTFGTGASVFDPLTWD